MTTLQDAASSAAPAAPPAVPVHPHVRAVVGRVAVTILTAVVVPAVLFASSVVMFSLIVGVFVALAWVAGVMSWRWATGRPVSGLLVLTLGLMTAKTAFLLVTGNSFVYFVQPVFIDAAMATTFLGSLRSTQPLVARLAPDFFPVDAAVAARAGVRDLYRRLTVMWGLVILLKGTVTLCLLLSLPTVDYVVVKGAVIITLTLLSATVTVVWSLIVARREGVLHPARRAS